MAKILIDEEVLDNLILKSLPKEYEVLLNDTDLTEEEQEYFYYILLILNGQIDEAKKWITSNEFDQIVDNIEKLPLNFFDDFKLKIRVYLQDKFEVLLIPLLYRSKTNFSNGYWLNKNSND